MHKVEKYISEFRSILHDMVPSCSVRSDGNSLHIAFRTEAGVISIKVKFYIQSIHAMLCHSGSVHPDCREQAADRFCRLNRYLDEYIAYRFSESGGPILTAIYDTSYDDPVRDAGLPEFCHLLVRTAPVALDRIIEEFSVLQIHNNET